MPEYTKEQYSKEPYSCEEHIKLLTERGLLIENEARAIKYIETIGYYRLSGYMFHLQNKASDNTFVPNTSFDDIINIYKFDKALRSIILEYIERIEVCIRAKISNHYSLRHGFFWYLDEKLFADQNAFSIIKEYVIENFNDPKEHFLKAFKWKYSNNFPPSIMVMEILTFGKVAKLYSGLNNDETKKAIADEFSLLPDHLSSWLIYINNVRNICAHHSRLWNKRVTANQPIIPQRKKNKFNGSIPENFNTSVYGIISIIDRLLSSFNKDNSFAAKISELVNTFNIDATLMGFPDDWKTNATWLS